ncbi:hypothetical protein ACB092_12G201800 [Castanea dentata]
MSRILGDAEQQFSMGGLIPHDLHKLDVQAFTPQLISIGPIHYYDAKLQTMKKFKVEYGVCLIERARLDLEHLLKIVRESEKKIHSYYAKEIVHNISKEDFVKMIVVDGMFILENFLRKSYSGLVDNEPRLDDWMPSILKLDLVLLENQLPFFVLEMLFEPVRSSLARLGSPLPLPLRELALEFFQCYNPQTITCKTSIPEIEHLTDLVRLFYIGGKLPERISGGAKPSYSAIQLHEAGVKFKRVEFGGEKGVEFGEKGEVLEIPCITLNNEKVRLIQNIIALEQSLYVWHAYVTDFFVILDFLIDTSKDVDLLCDKGILVNYLGDSKTAASIVNNLNKNISWDYMNPNYSKICEDLNAFYKTRWHQWKATLWRQYFSTPWRAASTSAAIILLLLTAIQTVCSLKSTIW